MVEAPFSWTGFYLGVNLGGKSGRFSDTLSAAAFPVGTLGFASSSNTSVVGGGQLGYLWQVSQWVFGVEGDFDGTGLRRTATAVAPVPAPFIPGDSISIRNNWQASARGRLGWTWDRAMIYATGGGAWANLKSTGTFAPVGAIPGLTTSTDRTLFGWTLGGGFDYAVAAGWSLGAEYRFTRFENNKSVSLGALPITTVTATPLTLTSSLNTNEVTARLSYHFNAGAPVARY